MLYAHVEVVRAVSRGRVDKAGARSIGNVRCSEEWHRPSGERV